MDRGGDWLALALPRTVVGFAVWLLIFFLGAAVAGTVVFVGYQSRVTGLREQLEEARQDLAAAEAKVKQLEATLPRAGETRTQAEDPTSPVELDRVLQKVASSIAHIEGKDASGAPTVGSGFVVNSDADESWVITSQRLVAGAIANEETVSVRVGNVERRSTVYIGDDRRDLAVIVLRVGALPFLQWFPGDPVPGTPVWAVGASPSRTGAAGLAGKVLDAAPDGVLTNIDVPVHMNGAPLVDRDGKVVAVISTSYAPEDFGPTKGWAVPIRLACSKVLRCPR